MFTFNGFNVLEPYGGALVVVVVVVVAQTSQPLSSRGYKYSYA